ncbi:MAG: hypothetical protein H6Q09_1669 [Acidobacteria bacterium]|nr:hypothetical protein [Acidobacteriota bacterium]
MSDGENNGSLAGLWHRASRFLPGSVRPEPGGWEADGGSAVYPSRSRRPLTQAMAAPPAPVIVNLGPVIRSNVSCLGSHLACKLYPEDLYPALDQPFARGKEG